MNNMKFVKKPLVIILLACAFSLGRSDVAIVADDLPPCGHDAKTYSSPLAAYANGTTIMHCGPCGSCSNKQDIGVYVATAQTLTNVALQCGQEAAPYFALGQDAFVAKAVECIEGIGFTEPCSFCWAADILCVITQCINIECAPTDFACLVACDERKCGPSFVACAGANRRRAGIVTDLDRLSSEICHINDPFPPPLVYDVTPTTGAVMLPRKSPSVLVSGLSERFGFKGCNGEAGSVEARPFNTANFAPLAQGCGELLLLTGTTVKARTVNDNNRGCYAAICGNPSAGKTGTLRFSARCQAVPGHPANSVALMQLDVMCPV